MSGNDEATPEHGLDASTRWCAGLPFVGEQRLSEAQRELAMRIQRRVMLRLAVYAVLSLLLLPLSAAATYQLRATFGDDSWVPIAFSMMLFFFALPITVAKTITHARLALPLRRDLTVGLAQCFAGTIAAARYEDEDPDVIALVEAGALVRGAGEQALAVLPTSARLISVNGRDVLPERRLHVATTAASQQNMLRYSLPPDVKQAFGMQRGLKRRRFGESERRELDEHIARLTAVPWMLVVLTAFVAITISTWVVRGVGASQQWMSLGWVVAWVIVAVRHVRSYLLARRFEDDLEVGWLLSWETPEVPTQPAPAIRPSQPHPNAQGAPAPSSAGLPFATAEVLPISQMDWTIDGKPAAWRRVIQRVRS